MVDRDKGRKTYYEILEIRETATLEEIKKAYKRLALKYHPDRAHFTNISPEKFEALFKELREAYETLSTPQKRSWYDIRLNKASSFQSWNAWNKFNENQWYPHFWEQKSRSNEPPPSEPTASEREDINDLIRNDNAKQLATYLKTHNFSSQSLYIKKLLSFATQQGSLNVVKYLVEERKMNPKLIVTGSSFFQGSIFKYAAASGNLDLVKYLLEEHHADIESQATTLRGCCGTALSYAARKGHRHIVEYLIKKGANVNPEVTNSNLLNEAIASGKLPIVKLLVEAGTKLDDYHLSQAFEQGHIDITQYILQRRPGISNHRFLNPPACLVIQSGNLDLLIYLEKYEALDIFIPYEYQNNINISLLSAAARSGNLDMMRYLLNEKGLLSECQKTENANQYITAILGDAVKESGFHHKKIDVPERLKLVRFLIEVNKFILPTEKLIYLIQEEARFSSIEMNAYLHSYLPDLENHRDMLLTVAFHGLAKLNNEELFRLYNLNILKQGKYGDFEDTIHYHINHRNISHDELKLAICRSVQFKTDALFYYSNYRCKNDLSQLRIMIDSGMDINIENSRGEIALQYAMRQGGYNNIVKFLIDNGADVYKQDQLGESIYNILKTNKEFLDQLERVSKTRSEHNANSQSYNINKKW